MTDLELDKPHCHCAIFRAFGHFAAAQMTYYGLLAQQHRGQEGSGIVTSNFDQKANKYRFHVHKDFGLVNDVYKDDRILSEVLKGSSAIGHNRYSTAGAADNKTNIQPLTVLLKSDSFGATTLVERSCSQSRMFARTR